MRIFLVIALRYTYCYFDFLVFWFRYCLSYCYCHGIAIAIPEGCGEPEPPQNYCYFYCYCDCISIVIAKVEGGRTLRHFYRTLEYVYKKEQKEKTKRAMLQVFRHSVRVEWMEWWKGWLS